jgi:hypothetical protein
MHDALKTAEGIAAVAIAIYVASVGTFQWFTARDKVRLDLYNRRFDVYTRAIDFMLALVVCPIFCTSLIVSVARLFL